VLLDFFVEIAEVFRLLVCLGLVNVTPDRSICQPKMCGLRVDEKEARYFFRDGQDCRTAVKNVHGIASDLTTREFQKRA